MASSGGDSGFIQNGPAAELDLARTLLRCRNFAAAVGHFESYLRMRPDDLEASVELAEALRFSGRLHEAAAVAQQALENAPGNLGATLALAQALAASGKYEEALLRYNAALQISPGNYDALEGKAFVLYWSGHSAEAQIIFTNLQARHAEDEEVARALDDIARAEDEARLRALGSDHGASAVEISASEEKYTTTHPDDAAGWSRLGDARVALEDYSAAAAAYRKALEFNAQYTDAELALARVLSWQQQYDESLRHYRAVVFREPKNRDALEGLAHVLTWSGQLGEAERTFQHLMLQHPDQANYALDLGKLQIRTGDVASARGNITTFLATHPTDRDARRLLAQLDVRQSDWKHALEEFSALLRADPNDSDALYGRAQVLYYMGDLRRAESAAQELAVQEPNSFDVAFLLANIERALRHRELAAAWLDKASRLSPGNSEVTRLRRELQEERPFTLHIFTSYAREIGRDSSTGAVPGSVDEDLRTYASGAILNFAIIPKSDSVLSVGYAPSQAPQGVLAGAVAPTEIMYRQTTVIRSWLTVRGGLGGVRFGPGTPLGLLSVHALLPAGYTTTELVHTKPDQIASLLGPGSEVDSARFAADGFAGFTVQPVRTLSADLNYVRSPTTLTPVSVQLGVRERRIEGALNFTPARRSNLHFSYFESRYSTIPYTHVTINAAGPPVISGSTVTADRDRERGGGVSFWQRLQEGRRLSLDAGYQGVAYGFEGRRNQVYMGFYNPRFYQRHLAVARSEGALRRWLRFRLDAGVGVQQIEEHEPLTRALNVSPALIWTASPMLAITTGYTYYNSAQALGRVSGNAARLDLDWKF